MNAPRRFLPSIPSLRALEALDRLGSATAVADELNQTQGAISRQLRTLEEQLGQSLFIRKSRRLTLTPEAETYAEEIRQALAQITRASMKLSLNPSGGTINLAILPTFGMRWLVPRLADFARQHPEVTINLSTRIEKFNFATEPFDAAIQFGSDMSPDTERLRLKPEAVIAVAAPDLLRGRTLAHPRDIQSLPLLHIASRPDAWTDWFTAQNVTPEHPAGTVHDQFSTLLQAALHGLGVALLPDYLVEQDLASGRLVAVWGGPVESRGAYHLVWPVEASNDPALKKFRDWLAGQAETEEDPLPR
ncbi:LysR substrate-binding domain-containing protein [Roseovarius sp. 2305UL8-3]|uniref:LysR substrate-binding domain-containing protein n=1 Tax=Roseovarius conchicola TaxID=3121636 RepID=UPI0035291114